MDACTRASSHAQYRTNTQEHARMQANRKTCSIRRRRRCVSISFSFCLSISSPCTHTHTRPNFSSHPLKSMTERSLVARNRCKQILQRERQGTQTRTGAPRQSAASSPPSPSTGSAEARESIRESRMRLWSACRRNVLEERPREEMRTVNCIENTDRCHETLHRQPVSIRRRRSLTSCRGNRSFQVNYPDPFLQVVTFLMQGQRLKRAMHKYSLSACRAP